jgi:phage FluMu gp28-like protein
LSTRIQFGFDYHVWSAHNGMGSWFNQVLGKIAKKPGSGWHCRKITIYDVVEEGLVEKINERAGTNMTREEFLLDCKRRALTPAIYAERFECSPSDSGSSIVPWGTIERARDVDGIMRWHLGDDKVRALFGLPTENEKVRVREMNQFMDNAFGPLKFFKERFRVGFDVAASGKGDLASIWVDGKTARGLEHRALLTTQTEDWDFLTTALMWFMKNLPDALGRGDSTGLGRQITLTAEQRTGGRFQGVPFTRGTKSAMGSRLMNQLSSGECWLAKGEDDVAMDLFALQKTVQGGLLVFEATQNPLNAASHCDMAWSKALAAEADAGETTGVFSSAKVPGGGRKGRLAKMLGW